MDTQITKTESQDSFEFGKAGSRMNLKFMTVSELDEKIKALKTLGYINEGSPMVPVSSKDDE